MTNTLNMKTHEWVTQRIATLKHYITKTAKEYIFTFAL